MLRRRRSARFLAAAVATGAIVGTGLTATQPAIASSVAQTDDDGNARARIAEAQFLVYLFTATELTPTEVTCAPPPAQNLDGDMVCFALVDGRQTVAAVASLIAPGTYTFTAITKTARRPVADDAQVAPTPGIPTPQPEPEAAPDLPENSGLASDAAVAAIDSAVSDLDGLTLYLAGEEPLVESVDSLTYDPATVTIQVVITTTGDPASDRDALAFKVTDTMAYLWEADRPIRDPANTVHPRLEVIVDGEIYGTPYDVMVGVADYTIEYDQWLSITTGANTFRAIAPSGLDARRYGARSLLA